MATVFLVCVLPSHICVSAPFAFVIDPLAGYLGGRILLGGGGLLRCRWRRWRYRRRFGFALAASPLKLLIGEFQIQCLLLRLDAQYPPLFILELKPLEKTGHADACRFAFVLLHTERFAAFLRFRP